MQLIRDYVLYPVSSKNKLSGYHQVFQFWSDITEKSHGIEENENNCFGDLTL